MSLGRLGSFFTHPIFWLTGFYDADYPISFIFRYDGSMRIALMLNPLSVLYPEQVERFDAVSRSQVIALIEEALRKVGQHVSHLTISADLAVAEKWRQMEHPHVVFYQSVRLDADQPPDAVPLLLERMGIPYTGAGPAACRIAQDKRYAKQLLAAAGLRTRDFAVISRVNQYDPRELPPYPLFVKPLRGGCSFGIPLHNPVYSEAELKAAMQAVMQVSQQPALVETYLDGREFSVGVLGNSPPAALPVMEYTFKDGARFRTFSGKTERRERHEQQTCPACLTKNESDALAQLALEVFGVIGCRDYARVDLRCDSSGLPYVLEINPHPSLLLDSSFPCMAAAAGYSYLELLEAILSAALERYGLNYTRG